MFRPSLYIIHDIFNFIWWLCFIVLHVFILWLIMMLIRFHWFLLFNIIFGGLSYKILVFKLVRNHFERTSSNILNEHWLRFGAKHLLVRPNQQCDPNSEINVSSTNYATFLTLSCSLLNGYSTGSEYDDKKQMNYNGRFFSFATVNKMWKSNRYWGAFLLLLCQLLKKSVV